MDKHSLLYFKSLVDDLTRRQLNDRNMKKKIEVLKKKNNNPALLGILTFIHLLRLWGISSFPYKREEQVKTLLCLLDLRWEEVFGKKIVTHSSNILRGESETPKDVDKKTIFVIPILHGKRVYRERGEEKWIPRVGRREDSILKYNHLGLTQYYGIETKPAWEIVLIWWNKEKIKLDGIYVPRTKNYINKPWWIT